MSGPINFSTLHPNNPALTASSVQIGDEAYYHDSGYLRTNPDGSVWLGSGTLAAASAYPQAAKLEYMQAVGQPRTLPTSAAITDYATDGAQRWVAAYGDLTNVFVSTDDGVTWANVAHNAGGPVVSVTFSAALGLWIGAGNSAAAFYVATQAQASVASAWTVRTGSAITAATANSACVRASASEVVMVCAGATTGAASRSTNGTTYSAVNLSSALAIASTNICRLSNNASNFVAFGASNGAVYSNNGGASFADCSISSNGQEPYYIGGAWFCLYAGSIWKSTDNGATWSQLVNNTSLSALLSPVVDSGRVYCLARADSGGSNVTALGYSTDGVNFKFKSLSSFGASTSPSIKIGVSGSTVIFQSKNTASTVIYQDNFNAPFYIGVAQVIRNQLSSSSNFLNRLYQCIKKGN